MADVEFNEGYSQTPASLPSTRTGSGMEQWLMRMGWAKDVTQARQFLWAILIIAVCTAGMVVFFGFRDTTPTPVGPREQTMIPGPGGKPAGNLHDAR